MLDAYQHTSGTCYRNYHGQNDFIYDFTASQTLEGHISSISHRAVLGRYTMLVHYWVEYFLYFFKFPTWSICSKVDISTLPMIPATPFIQNRTWVTTTLVQHDVSVKLQTLGTETFTFCVWSTWRHTWCTQEPLAASEMVGGYSMGVPCALVGGHGGVSIMSGWLLRQQLHRMWSCRGMKCEILNLGICFH